MASLNGDFAITNDRNLWGIALLGDEKAVKILDDVKIADAGIAIKNDGSLWTWSSNGNSYTFGSARGYGYSIEKIMYGISSASIGWSHNMIIKEDSSLWTYGRNDEGQLGDGSTVDSANPIKIMDDVAIALAYANYSMAVKKDGSLWTWGENDEGQLGDGTTTNRLKPTKILDKVKSLSAENRISTAIKTDGSLWGWGKNSYTPVRNTKKAKFISGEYFIDENNKLLMWRFSRDGSSYNLSSREILEDIDFVSGSSWNTSMAIKADRSLWGWGDNNSGQMGDGSANAYRSEPFNVMNSVAFVSAGGSHTLAIKDDGSLWGWGDNYEGQLGIGTTQNEYKPIKVTDNVKSVSIGRNSTMLIKNDGSLWACGNYNHGLPTKVSFASNVSNELQVMLGGETLSFDVSPTIINGRTLVPLRAIFEAMGATVQWDNSTRTVTANKGAVTIVLTIGSLTPTVNGKQVSLDVPGTIVDSRTMVPARFIAESLGANVDWDDNTKTVLITTGSKSVD